MDAYWRAITVIEAQDLLMKMKLADFPNSSAEVRAKWHREIHSKAYPDSEKELTVEELGKRLGVMV